MLHYTLGWQCVDYPNIISCWASWIKKYFYIIFQFAFLSGCAIPMILLHFLYCWCVIHRRKCTRIWLKIFQHSKFMIAANFVNFATCNFTVICQNASQKPFMVTVDVISCNNFMPPPILGGKRHYVFGLSVHSSVHAFFCPDNLVNKLTPECWKGIHWNFWEV